MTQTISTERYILIYPGIIPQRIIQASPIGPQSTYDTSAEYPTSPERASWALWALAPQSFAGGSQ